MQSRIIKKALFMWMLVIVGVLGSFFIDSALASGGPSAVSLASITTNINTTVGELAKILSDIALVAGIGFILASFFKFHQHKLNPTQVPISQGVTLLLIGTGLLLFPTMLPTAKQSIFGSGADIGTVGGSQISALIGGDVDSGGV
jgi:intracellular multiplication protein IcmD